MAIAFVAHRMRQGGTAAPAVTPSRAKGLFWSTLSGLASTIAHAGGPPLSVYLLPQKLDKAVLVGTTVIFFAVINATKLVPYFWLGLFDQPYVPDTSRADQVVRTRESLEVALGAARQSIVLLKNDGGVLPIGKHVKSILVTGPGADEKESSISRYGPGGLTVVSALEGIRRAAGQNQK